MATHIPDKLKTADLTRFIVRAAQLETVKPVVAYWCEYWIVNQILSKGLHNGDNETLQYTTTLMDKLEQIKSDNALNDAIMDDAAGKAYVENFGLETFFRADRAVKANAVTKQTADTFQAAATFLELLNIWGTPDADTLAKIRYAKWNAVRTVKALKEGKDPNESNPKPEPASEEDLPALDPNDPEVQMFGESARAKQPFVEDVPDEQDQIDGRAVRQASIDQSLHPSKQVSAQASAQASPSPAFEPFPPDGFPYTAVQDDNVSPLEPSPHDRNGSIGGGYFPEVPTSHSEALPSNLPQDDTLGLGLPQQPSAPPVSKHTPDFESFPPPALPDDPSVLSSQDFYHQAPSSNPPQHFQSPPGLGHQGTFGPSSNQERQFNMPPPIQQYSTLPPDPRASIPSTPQHYNASVRMPPPAQQYSAPSGAPVPELRNDQLITDDVAIAKAQKHARWAISALNFEDAATAVKEMRAALKTLGAS